MCKDNLNCNMIYLDIRLTYNMGVIPISKTILYKGYLAPIFSVPRVLDDYITVFRVKSQNHKPYVPMASMQSEVMI